MTYYFTVGLASCIIVANKLDF